MNGHRDTARSGTTPRRHAAKRPACPPARAAVISLSVVSQVARHITFLEQLGVSCVLTEDVASALWQGQPRIAIVPAFTELHAHRLGGLTETHPTVAVVGVVSDQTGHLTHRAIQHGALWVLNLLLPEQCHINVLRACTDLYAPLPAHDEPATPARANGDDGLLIQFLCGPAPVTEIAHRLYCSERSLYRRMRRLYKHLGVTSRCELRALLSNVDGSSPSSP